MRESDAAHEVGEARVRAQAVECRVNFEKQQRMKWALTPSSLLRAYPEFLGRCKRAVTDALCLSRLMAMRCT